MTTFELSFGGTISVNLTASSYSAFATGNVELAMSVAGLLLF